MADKHIKICLTLLIIKEVQIKATRRYCYINIKITEKQQQQMQYQVQTMM